MCRYLFPAWCIGFILRHLVLFPLRVLLIFLVMTSFCAVFFPIHTLLKVSSLATCHVAWRGVQSNQSLPLHTEFNRALCLSCCNCLVENAAT